MLKGVTLFGSVISADAAFRIAEDVAGAQQTGLSTTATLELGNERMTPQSRGLGPR